MEFSVVADLAIYDAIKPAPHGQAFYYRLLSFLLLSYYFA